MGICHELLQRRLSEKENLSVVPSLTIMKQLPGIWRVGRQRRIKRPDEYDP